MNIFAISDLHLFHANLLRGQKIGIRPFDTLEEMHERIVEGWNGVVRARDKVYMLGDLTLIQPKKGDPWGGKLAELLPLCRRLSGKKRLLLGNHDHMGANAYHALGFEKIMATKELGERPGTLLSHYPVHPNQVCGVERGCRYAGNVHGHTHEASVQMVVPGIVGAVYPSNLPYDDLRYLNVCVEAINYTPMSLEEIRAEFKNRGVI